MSEDHRPTEQAALERAVRAGFLQPAAATATLGAHIVNVLAPVPLLGVVAAPFTMAAAAVDIVEGRHEHARRSDQRPRAEDRKAAMAKLLEESRNDPEYDLLEGIVAGLTVQQDRLIRQAKRETTFAKMRKFKGGAVIGGTLGHIAGVATLAATMGVTAGATGGLGAIPPALAGAVFAGGLAVRNHKRVRAEHTSKWRERAMHAATFGLSRKQLENKLSGMPGEDRHIRVEHQEGEYLPQEMRFAGERVVEFDVRNNEYAALLALAYKVQDLVLKGNYDPENPFMKLLDICGVDELKLLAICKAASAKPANVQLDFIQSKLAPAFGMKVRLAAGGRRALPHVSVFLGHLEQAKNNVKTPLPYAQAQQLGELPASARTRIELLKIYHGDEARLEDFKNAVDQFLKKTEGLPSPDQRRELKAFHLYLSMNPSLTLTATSNAQDASPNATTMVDRVDAQQSAEEWPEGLDEIIKDFQEDNEKESAQRVGRGRLPHHLGSAARTGARIARVDEQVRTGPESERAQASSTGNKPMDEELKAELIKKLDDIILANTTASKIAPRLRRVR